MKASCAVVSVRLMALRLPSSGPSFTATTFTVLVMLGAVLLLPPSALLPETVRLVIVRLRAPAVGLSVLRF